MVWSNFLLYKEVPEIFVVTPKRKGFHQKKNEMTDRSEENEIVECKKLKIAKVREKMSESIYYDDVVNNWLIPFFYYKLCRFWSRPNSEWGY